MWFLNKARTNPAYAYFDDVFSADELKYITERIRDQKKIWASTYNDKDPKTPNKAIRASKINWLAHDMFSDVYQRVCDIINTVNDEWFGYDLTAFENLQYTEYSSRYKGHYDFHVDSSGTHATPLVRKLSVSIQLSDNKHEGGEFWIRTGIEPLQIETKQARAILFPSWIQHRVTPVTKGVRKSLVTWTQGPQWK